EADDGEGELADGTEDAKDLLALTAVRQDQGDVVGVDHAEIAVQRLGGVEDVGARAGRIERAGEFLTDVGGFAGAGDGDTAGAAANATASAERGLSVIGKSRGQGQVIPSPHRPPSTRRPQPLRNWPINSCAEWRSSRWPSSTQTTPSTTW